jgi:AcrR family transcriptional regulator
MEQELPKDGIEADQPARKRRKDARPGELIEAGLKEFATRGFAATRLEDVAKRAGVAKGTIYRYFADKEALFLAAMRLRVSPLHEQASAFIDVFPGTTRELLTLLFSLVHEQMVNSDMRTLMRVVIAEGENFPALTEHYYTESVAKGREIIGRVIERGIARGEVRPGAAADLPIVVMAPAIMAAIWRMTFERHAPIAPEAFMAAHLDLVFDGLLTR